MKKWLGVQSKFFLYLFGGVCGLTILHSHDGTCTLCEFFLAFIQKQASKSDLLLLFTARLRLELFDSLTKIKAELGIELSESWLCHTLLINLLENERKFSHQLDDFVFLLNICSHIAPQEEQVSEIVFNFSIPYTDYTDIRTPSWILIRYSSQTNTYSSPGTFKIVIMGQIADCVSSDSVKDLWGIP